MGTDRGSSLMLMPAAVLVVMVLGAIAVDQSIVYTQQRELVAAAEAAANDAAGYGLDRDAFYDRNEVVFDLARARAAALAALRARRIDARAVVSLGPGRYRGPGQPPNGGRVRVRGSDPGCARNDGGAGAGVGRAATSLGTLS